LNAATFVPPVTGDLMPLEAQMLRSLAQLLGKNIQE
jgi:hypothetical protein